MGSLCLNDIVLLSLLFFFFFRTLSGNIYVPKGMVDKISMKEAGNDCHY